MVHQSVVVYLSYVAAFFSTICFIPQAIKTLMAENTRSISLLSYILLLSGALLWGLYGLFTNQIAIIVTNAIVTILVSIILCKKTYNMVRKID